ncbi:MAG TPA: cytochrome C oxidase subunit IV family protein [Chthoniobacterales bacterium]|jgi:cytochrome c oxidase subunit 4
MNPHGPTARVYLLNGAALLFFLALTIAAAYLNLGALNTIVAMAIAFAKGALIVLFFMHMRYNKPVLWLFAGAGFFWLGIMFALALSDYLTRG